MRKRLGCLLLADVVTLTSLTGTNTYAVYAESERQTGSEETEIPELAGKDEAAASEEEQEKSEQNVRDTATSEEEESERNVERNCWQGLFYQIFILNLMMGIFSMEGSIIFLPIISSSAIWQRG